MPRVGNPHRREPAGAELRHHRQRIAPIGLHPIARLLGNERRRHHNALVAQAGDLPVKAVPGRPRLVTKRHPAILGRKLAHQLGRRRRRVVDLAEKPHFARPPRFRNRHRVAQLRRIDRHQSFAMIPHNSPSLCEALPGLSG